MKWLVDAAGVLGFCYIEPTKLNIADSLQPSHELPPIQLTQS